VRLGHKTIDISTVNINIPYPDFKSIQVFGGNGEGETPVPIPNTEVKPFCADGTAREAVWESRSPPKFFKPGAI
jgi:hypothetical protein